MICEDCTKENRDKGWLRDPRVYMQIESTIIINDIKIELLQCSECKKVGLESYAAGE